ncbi:MAG TPA: hypothetical protein VNT81_11355, partial [Vicinamibacterales bacterium]|nr:hypothetical protein [Vicinamibacterales bacterium]
FEEGVRASLTGMALLALANPAAAFEFQRAITLETPPAPVQFLLAASRALSGRDQEAIAGWQAARAAGFAPALVDGVIAESYLRIKDFPRAAAVMPVRPSSRDRAELMTFAATRIAVGREAEAVTVLDDLLAGNPGDLDARWLLVHAVYAQIVNGDSSARDRFLIEAARYVAANGAHRALASAWREALLR